MEKEFFYLLDTETNKILKIEGIKNKGKRQWQSLCPKCKRLGQTLIINKEAKTFHCYGCGWKGVLKKSWQFEQQESENKMKQEQEIPVSQGNPVSIEDKMIGGNEMEIAANQSFVESQTKVLEGVYKQNIALTSKTVLPVDPVPVENNISNFHLSPSHLEDLRKSGLNDKTIKEAGVNSVRPGEISKICNHPKVESMLAFPYPGTGHVRYKLFSSEPILDRDGHPIKYYQPKGSSNRLYIPERVRAVLLNPSIPLHITEGEKKTLKMNQEDFYCIGLGGLWSWADGNEEKNLISDFDSIQWNGREVYLDPDNDFLKPDRHGDKKNTRQAVYELAYKLIDRGAKSFINYLPEGTEKGGDDYLCNHTVDEYKALKKESVRKYSLDEMIESLTGDSFTQNQKEMFSKLSHLSNSERDLKFIAISKKTKIKVSSLRNDFNSFMAKEKVHLNVSELLETCEQGCGVFTAQNYYNGILSYGAVFNGNKLVIESNKNVIQSSKDVNMKFWRSKFTKEAIKRFMAGEDVNGKELYDGLSRLFSDHVYFDDKRIPGLLALWVIGTYFFKAFSRYGYILLGSIIKRCGKSLLEELLSCVCHNSTSRSIRPSESSVFRQVDGDDITLIIDEVETLSAKENPDMVGLINSGFEKGSTVMRMEARGKEWVSVSFNAYSPKVLAGIRSVSDTIEDRSFKIPMVRKAPGEKVKRFNVRQQEYELQLMRDDLYIFGLNHGPDVIEVYDGATGHIPEMEGLDDRQKDILEPLACVAMVIDELSNDEDRTVFNDLIELSKAMGRKRLSQEKLDGSVTAILEIMDKEMGDQQECFIPVTKMFDKANLTDGLSFKNTRQLGRYMARFDIYSDQRKISGENVRGYSITKAWLEDQKRRYVG